MAKGLDVSGRLADHESRAAMPTTHGTLLDSGGCLGGADGI